MRRHGHTLRRRLLAVATVSGLAFGAACSASGSGNATGSNTTGSGPGRAPAEAHPDLQLAAALEPFNACDDLLAYVKQAAAERVGPYGLPGSSDDLPTTGVAEDAGPTRRVPAAPPSTAAPSATVPSSTGGGTKSSGATTTTGEAASSSPANGTAEHSETNVQEKGVDEPDTIKTDGSRILAVTNGRLVDIDVRGAAPTNAGSLALPGNGSPQILLSGNHVLVITPDASYLDEVDRPAGGPSARRVPYGTASTLLSMVDIADPAHMRIVSNTRVDGEFVSARMVDGEARVVISAAPAALPFVVPSSNTAAAQNAAEEANRHIVEASTIEDWLPDVHIGNGSTPTTKQLLDCTQVSHPKTFSGFGVLAVLSVDVGADAVNPADAIGVMADGQTVYASKSTLYVSTPAYVDPPRNPSAGGTVPTTRLPAPVPLRNATSIHKFAIEARGPAVYRASGEVEGEVLNQYSFSEDEGSLRVATTTTPVSARGCRSCSGVESFVRVLQERDGQLVQVGQVGNMGHGEQIKAVRFVGKQGYVVTYRQTDPLYTLDLADPANPRVVGELKLLGYSAYLHPAGDNLVIGIGQDATDRGRTLGTKVALYDMADLANPRELSKYVLWNSTSEVEQDFHAFLWWQPTKLAMIPVNRAYVGWVDAGCVPGGSCSPAQYLPPFTGAIGLSIEAGGITELGRVVNPASPSPGCGSMDDCMPCPPDAFCSTATGGAPVGPTTVPAGPVAPPTVPTTTCVPQPDLPNAGGSRCIPVDGQAGAPIERSLVVGDTLYTFSANGLKSSNLADLHEKYWLPFA